MLGGLDLRGPQCWGSSLGFSVLGVLIRGVLSAGGLH